jgi:hypothetical protein
MRPIDEEGSFVSQVLDGEVHYGTMGPPQRPVSREDAVVGNAATSTARPTPGGQGPPPPSPRTKWTRRVPHPVLIGHAAFLSQAGGRSRTPFPPGIRQRA